MKKQYVYIGKYYHIGGKELPSDYKFGVTENLDQREYSLSRTKSPIKYMIVRAWEIPITQNREMVEKLISVVFGESKYDGCEWYDIDLETFDGKISSMFKILSTMTQNGEFSFQEVNLESESTSPVEKELENEIRVKASRLPLFVEIDGIEISGDNAKSVFVESIKFISSKVDLVEMALEFPRLLKSNPQDFPDYKQSQLEKINDFYLDCHSSTTLKRDILNKILEKYSISGVVK